MERTTMEAHLRALGLCAALCGLWACEGVDDGGGGADGAMDGGSGPDPSDPHPDAATDDDEDAGTEPGADAAVDPDLDLDAGTEQAPELAIIGNYVDEWGGVHRIEADAWILGWTPDAATFAIADFDNDARVLVAQNGADNAWNPGLWSRFEWAWDGEGRLRYCQVAYAADSEQAALDAAAADAGDFDAGCGGFGWSVLTPGEGSIAIAGDYTDEWGGTHRVSDVAWVMGWTPDAATFGPTRISNSMRYVIAHNGADNAWNPGLWSRFDWAWDGDGQLRFCQVAFAAADEQAALDTPAPDAGDFDAGCGGFGWSTLTPGQGPIAIAGDYQEGAGGLTHAVTADGWTRGDGSVFAFSQHDNALRFVVARNDAGNAQAGGLWSRFDWTWDGVGALFVCHTVGDAIDEATALDTPAADAADPAVGGCAGGAWTALEPLP